MAKTVKGEIIVAAASLTGEFDKHRNMKRIIEMIEEAAEKKASLVAFPECGLQGYPWGPDVEAQKKYYAEVAEPVPGPTTELLAKYAALYKMYISIGMAEKGRGGATHNSTALIGPKGVVGVQRRVHLSNLARQVFTAGNEFSVFDTSIGKVGSLICMDGVFPESARCLFLKGAQIALFQSAWFIESRIKNYPGIIGLPRERRYYVDFYRTITVYNAMLNKMWLVAANQVGQPKGAPWRYGGRSRIVSPSGDVLVEGREREEVVTARINVEEGIRLGTRDYFGGIDTRKERLPEAYSPIVDPAYLRTQVQIKVPA